MEAVSHYHPHLERHPAGGRAAKSETLPRPLTASSPYALLALVPLVVGATGLVAWAPALGLSLCIALGAVVRGLVEWYWLVRDRQKADRWIRMHPRGRPTSGVVAARIGELTAPGMRRSLARSLRNAVRAAMRPPTLSASPMDLAGVRSEAPVIESIAARLADLEWPVNARGVLLTLDLLTNAHGGSPLYERSQREELHTALARVRAALDNHR